MTTYTVCRSSQGSEAAQRGLTKQEVMRVIYNDDGHGFYLVPRMENITDDEGVILGERQATMSVDETMLDWDVVFTDHHGNKSRPHWAAFGCTEKDAEEEFLARAYDNMRFDYRAWHVWTDEDFSQYEAEVRAQLEAEVDE